MVQVVSILEVPRILVSVSFQSNDVSGAQYSELLFCKKQQQSTLTVHEYAESKPP